MYSPYAAVGQTRPYYHVSTWLKVIRYFCSSFVALIKLYLLYIGTHNTEKLSLRHLVFLVATHAVPAHALPEALVQEAQPTFRKVQATPLPDTLLPEGALMRQHCWWYSGRP